MKEKPILFSGPMVKALLAGTKTQTRRMVKPQPTRLEWFEHQKGWLGSFGDDAGSRSNPHRMVPCPYGVPGDRLWVRETHFESRKWRHAPVFAAAPDFIYRADYEYREELNSVIGCHHWRPSIFMKREASRIVLEIVGVRVERLNDISAIDAWNEGCPYHRKADPTPDDVKAWYRDLWESINGPGSWFVNPWVWVVEFKRHQS